MGRSLCPHVPGARSSLNSNITFLVIQSKPAVLGILSPTVRHWPPCGTQCGFVRPHVPLAGWRPQGRALSLLTAAPHRLSSAGRVACVEGLRVPGRAGSWQGPRAGVSARPAAGGWLI